MALDNNEYGGQASKLLDLVRDLTMSGAKLPPIFAQLLQVHGQWIQASRTVGITLMTLVPALLSFRKGLESAGKLFDNLNKNRDRELANELAGSDKRTDKRAFIKARETYKETGDAQAAQQVYRREATKEARQKAREARTNANELLDKIRRESTDAANEAAQRAYNDILQRARRAGYSRPEELAERARRTAYRDTYNASRYSAQNRRAITEAQERIAAANQNVVSARQTATRFSRSGGFMRSVTSLSGAARAAMGLGIGAAVQAAYTFGMDYWNRLNRKWDGDMKKNIATQQMHSKITITGIQQASQLRQAAFKAEEEMDRKRFENLRILAESKTKMNEADLAMQERLQNIEKQRLAAQKEIEIFRQKVSQAKETRQHYDEYYQGEAQVRDSAQLDSGAWKNVKAFFTGRRDIVDERGVRADASVERAVDKAAYTKRGEQRALTSLLSTAKMAREASMAAVKADFDEFVTAYESFAETISSSTVGAMAPEIAARINKIKEDSEKWMKNSSENQVTMAAGELYSHSFEENVQAGRIKYDNETGHYVYQNEEGITIAIKDASEFNDDRSREGAQAAAIAKQRAEEEQKRIEEERKLAEKLHSYQQAQVALVQEQVKKQEELLKNLRDAVAKNYESDITGLFGAGNRKTGSEITELMRNRADESMRDAILASRRFSGNAQAAGEYKLQTDINMAGLRDLRKVDSTFHKEYLEQYKKNQTELYALRRKNIVEEHTLAMQNNTKIFQAYIDAAKQQREAYFRMLDKQLSMEVSASTTYGRAQTEVMQEQQLTRIAQAFDELKTNFENAFKIQKAASDAEFDEAVREDESRFTQGQLKDRQRAETAYLAEKFKLERQLTMEEHKLRIELIKAEYEIKRDLAKAEKERDSNNLSDMERIAATANKEKLDELSGLNFNGKKYNELTSDEKKELFSSIATQQNARLNEGMEYAGKRSSDYTDERGRELQGDELREAVRRDVMEAYNKLDDKAKAGALGQRYLQVAEGLRNSVENQVMDADAASERKYETRARNSVARFDTIAADKEGRFNAIAQRAAENEITYANRKSALENRQQLETNTRNERINQLKAAREFAWDDMHQQGVKSLELRQKEEEEGFKIGVRQIARHETAATNAFTERLSATSGGQWSSAVLKERNEQRFNNALDDLEDRHAAERRQALSAN